MKKNPELLWLTPNDPLPTLNKGAVIESPLDGLIAAGGGLSVLRLQEAYGKGMFPWFSERQPVLWWSPDPRMVLQTADFKLHRSLRKTIQNFILKKNHEIRFDTAFESVIANCSQQARPGQDGTWIVQEMRQAYVALHRAGVAHSVETWIDGQLVGGLYCVNLGRCIFGESMFSHQTDASKIALAALVAFAKSQQMPWIDCQQNTKHLASLCAKEMPRDQFIELVALGSSLPSPPWEFRPIYWKHILPSST
jgi:leucyl/phenylalanyl-tRNA--protein transferase